MKIGPDGSQHLTYCTNVHPGETWPEVRANLERYVLPVARRMAPDRPFGVGLRLSGIAAKALREADTLSELRSFLAANRLYVFTINGFPYGTFHQTRVKENVYLPDWRDPARLDYTNDLATVLAALLPDGAIEGSVSTVPCGFRTAVKGPDEIARIADAMIAHAGHLVEIRRRTGRTIALALEPEPCCLLETVAEAIAFFERHLHSDNAARSLASRTGLGIDDARAALRRHLGLCLDLCHAAVEFEDAADAISGLRRAGIRVAKIQVSAGLRLPRVDRDSIALLRPFDDGVYLHQVVERNARGLVRYTDLDEAFATLDGGTGTREWRVHFHVPIFMEDLGKAASTQPFLREVLALHRQAPISDHLEVETYTWGVLPSAFRETDVVAAIARELQWTGRQLAGVASAQPA